jgi:hypothetical protein
VGELSLCAHTWDTAARPRGAVVTDGDRCQRPLCHECSHSLVIGSMAGSAGPGTGH